MLVIGNILADLAKKHTSDKSINSFAIVPIERVGLENLGLSDTYKNHVFLQGNEVAYPLMTINPPSSTWDCEEETYKLQLFVHDQLCNCGSCDFCSKKRDVLEIWNELKIILSQFIEELFNRTEQTATMIVFRPLIKFGNIITMNAQVELKTSWQEGCEFALANFDESKEKC